MITNWSNNIPNDQKIIYNDLISKNLTLQPHPYWQANTTSWYASGGAESYSSSDQDSPSDLSFSSHNEATDTSSSENSFCHPETSYSQNDLISPCSPKKKIRNVRKSDKHHCAVCGDRPTGYHYDVLSCNGCKTFFRRTIINNRAFKCSKGGKCQFNKDFRCACRACRFDKCIKVGMNKNAIQYRGKEDESTSGSDNRSPSNEDEDNDNQEETNMIVPCTISKDPEEIDYLTALNFLIHREQSAKSIRKPGFPIITNHSLGEVLRCPPLLGCIQNIKDKHDEKIWRQEQYNINPIRYWMIADLYLAVEYAKTFKTFQKLEPSDQRALISEVACVVQICSQAYYSSQENCESIIFPDGINPLAIRLQTHKEFESHYRTAYCKPVAMIRNLNLTESEFVFFKTLALFCGNSLEISKKGRHILELARQRCLKYFRTYMIREYGVEYGVQKFGRVITAISSFLELSERKRSYLEVCHLMSKINLCPMSKGIYLKTRE